VTTPAPDIVNASNLHDGGPIGAYPPRQCFFRAYLDSHPAYAKMPRDRADVASERRSDAGLVFEMAIFDRIRARAAAGEFALADLTGAPDVPEDRPPHRGGQATWATRHAMSAGAEIIIGGVIRAEVSRQVSALREERVWGALPGGMKPLTNTVRVFLVGKPDILVLDRASGSYMPVDVKHHKARTGVNGATPARLGLLGGALDFDAMPQSPGFGSDRRRTDGFQLAHYMRILLRQYRGLRTSRMYDDSAETSSAADLRGGIIGSDCVDPTDPDVPIEIAWHDLGLPPRGLPYAEDGVLRARSEAKRAKQREWLAAPSVFREQRRALHQAVDNHLRGLTSLEPGTPGEAVAWGRVGKSECVSCERRSLCRDMAGPDDPSFAFNVGRPNQAGWAYLYEHGGDTVAALADFEPAMHADAFRAADKAFSKNARTPALAEVVLRAQMIRDGVPLRKRTVPRLSGKSVRPITRKIPRADVAIDFDVEWADDGYVYQWGALMRRRLPDGSWPVGDYDSLTRLCFDALDNASAKALSEDFFAGLRRFVEAEQQAGRTVRIYHWTAPEKTKSKEALRQSDAQIANTIDELLPGIRIDLKKWVEDGWWSAQGYSIKVVAPACGFKWDVDDPGGEMSMIKVELCRARAGDWEAAQTWLRDYNRSDCAAQSAIRDTLAE